MSENLSGFIARVLPPGRLELIPPPCQKHPPTPKRQTTVGGCLYPFFRAFLSPPIPPFEVILLPSYSLFSRIPFPFYKTRVSCIFFSVSIATRLIPCFLVTDLPCERPLTKFLHRLGRFVREGFPPLTPVCSLVLMIAFPFLS